MSKELDKVKALTISGAIRPEDHGRLLTKLTDGIDSDYSKADKARGFISNANFSPKHFSDLSKGKYGKVAKNMILRNKNLPSEHLDDNVYLDKIKVGSVLRHPNLTEAHINHLIKTIDNSDDARIMATNPNLHANHLRKLYNGPAKDYNQVIPTILGHKNVPVDVLDDAIKDYRLKEDVIGSPNHTREHLEKAMKMPGNGGRQFIRAAINSQHIRKPELEHYAENDSGGLGEFAKERLKNFK